MLQSSPQTDFPLGVGMVDTEVMPRFPNPDQFMPNLDYGISSATPLPDSLLDLQREIDDVKALVQTEPQGNDLRMFLFTLAASSDRFESTLVPLPPQFRAQAGHGCEVERLRRAIQNNWPSLRAIPTMFSRNEELLGLASDEIDAWHLLHWLLLPHPTYPTFRRLSILNLFPLCHIMGLGEPSQEPRQLISITYEATAPQQWKWRQEREGTTRYYAFLGLPLEMVYRYLYTGQLDIPPGEPIRLHLQMELVLQQLSQVPQVSQEEPQPTQPVELCWNNSFLANAQQLAVIICELPPELDESMVNFPDRHFLELLVQDSTTLKPCYLLMFEKPVAAKMMHNWPGNPTEMELASSSRSRIKRTTQKFSQVAHYINQRLEGVKKLLTKINALLTPN